MKTEVCNICGIEYPRTTEFFPKGKTCADGMMHRCKKCNYKRIKKWRTENKDRVNKSNSEWNKRNPDKIKKARAAKEKRDPIKYKKMRHASYIKNRDEKIARVKNWIKNNPEKARCSKKQRKIKERKNGITLTELEWNQTLLFFGGKCAYCGTSENVGKDHFVPIAKGGKRALGNMIPCCCSCNARKSFVDFDKWYLSCEFYSKEREEKILRFVSEFYHHV